MGYLVGLYNFRVKPNANEFNLITLGGGDSSELL